MWSRQRNRASESEITMKPLLHVLPLWHFIFCQFVHADLLFLIRFDFVTSNIGKMNRSICHAEKRTSFHKSRHASIFTRKTTQISQPPDPWIVNTSSVPGSRMLHGDLCKKTFKKRKEQWNDKPLRDCSRLSRHEWARVTLPQAVSPSISGSVTSSQPAPLDVFPCSWWAAMAGSVKCTRLVHRSADSDLSRHRRDS